MGIVYVVLSLWGVASLALALVWIAYVELVLARQSRKRRATGTLRDGGYRKPSASTIGREPGTPTRATATTAGCSFYSPRGDQLAASYVQTLLRRASSSTAPGVSTSATAAPGVSGEPPERAD